MDLIDESQVDMPPSYGSQEYWNKRFISEPEPFEWLEAPDVLDPYLRDALQSSSEPNADVLHIGCGTSNLSYHLRTIIKEPERIHNLDYSDVAIDLGRQREEELCREERFEDQQPTSSATSESMRWDTVDMLDHQSFFRVCKTGAYSVIVDKSTSDCIACCDDVRVQLPYTIDVWSESSTTTELRRAPEQIHPLHILAVHMAAATKPGARWIALSYSSDRFPFVDGLYSSRPHLPGFPDTGKLWKLIDKREVQNQGRDSVDTVGDRVVHRPKSTHWVYIMERTEIPLFVRGGHI
jgi:ubiquinone/menaquinone biosynthesis C-methylase UbiE